MLLLGFARVPEVRLAGVLKLSQVQSSDPRAMYVNRLLSEITIGFAVKNTLGNTSDDYILQSVHGLYTYLSNAFLPDVVTIGIA